MPGSSTTVGTLAIQIAALRQSQDELKDLLRGILSEMLRISQVQADSTLTMMRVIEEHQRQNAALQAMGPGTSRVRDEQSDYDAWRAELNAPVSDL
jgi:hypothetical protein